MRRVAEEGSGDASGRVSVQKARGAVRLSLVLIAALLAAGDERVGMEVVLASGSAIRGVVRWPDGRAAPGASVEVLDPTGRRAAQSSAGDSGAFETPALAGGPFDVVASVRTVRPRGSVEPRAPGRSSGA